MKRKKWERNRESCDEEDGKKEEGGNKRIKRTSLRSRRGEIEGKEEEEEEQIVEEAFVEAWEKKEEEWEDLEDWTDRKIMQLI